MTVFDLFEEVSFDYLVISRGGVYGNRIVSEKTLTGVFKHRSGMVQASGRESYDGKPTLKVHPEDFELENVDELVGNGVRYNGQTYRIDGATEGRNFDTDEVEHYSLTLERSDYATAS